MTNPEIDKYGNKRWYELGLLHRTTGPAVEYADGGRCWYQYNQLHRTDGPAIEHIDDTKYWYINDVAITESEANLLKFLSDD